MRVRTKAIAAIAASSLFLGAGVAVARTTGIGQTSPPPPAGTRAIGGGTSETKFVPIEPCRIVDTRQTAAGRLAAGQQRTFDVRGSGPTFAAQGGKPGGCGVNNATAVEVSITAVQPSGTGYVRAYPESEPNATFLNYKGIPTTNTGTVSLCGVSGGLCLVNFDLTIKNYTGNTHIVIDVQGYYTAPMSATITSSGSIVRSSRLRESVRTTTGEYRLRWDRDVSTCTYQVNVGNGSQTLSGDAGEAWITHAGLAGPDYLAVQTYESNGTLSDEDFHVSVTC